MIETILRKRPARHANEVGLFAETEMADEDLRLITNGNDVTVRISSHKNEQLRKFMWALATVVSRNVDHCYDKDDGLELLCVKCRHMRTKIDPSTGKLEIVRKSTRKMGAEGLRRLINRMVYVTCTDIIPGLQEGPLRAELEAIVGMEDPAGPPDAPMASEATQVAPSPENAPVVTTMPGKRRSAKVGPIKIPTTPPDFVHRSRS